MQAIWNIRQLTANENERCKKLAKQLNISPMAARLLVTRGITTPEEARQFIAPQLSQLHDPFRLPDMQKAVERLTMAIQNEEHILVYGDYDVDGTTAVALVYTFLQTQVPNIHLDYYIPDRYTEGYGISFQGIDYAQQQGCTLIIALDCGIKAVDKVNYARERNIDFIICDHHNPDEQLPEAVAVIDAKREDNQYPFRDLSGCGVGFKFMQAFASAQGIAFEALLPLLELTAMSIASDIVPVTGENRILAHHGLQHINKQPAVGVKALIHIAGIEQGQVNMADLVFRIGPRINACGRIKSGRDAVRLLTTQDAEEAQRMSEEINESNATRKDLDEQITQEALEQLSHDDPNRKTTVVCSKAWHKGVIGIVASRLTETYFRPTIVLTEADGIASGSARSVGGFDIYAAIDSCRDLLTNFGGHTCAAGLSMKIENLPEFRERFEAYVAAHILPEQQQPIIQAETEIDFADITAPFYNVVRHLEPFGPGNPRPIFVTRNVCNYRYTRAVGQNNRHLRLDVTDKTGVLGGIAFGMGKWEADFKNGYNKDICYEIGLNTYNGKTSLQMMVLDIK